MIRIGKLSPATTLAIGCALLLASAATARAQADMSDPGNRKSDTGSKSDTGKSDRSSTGAKTERQQPKSTDMQEHRLLTKAHQTGINQAQAVSDYVDRNKSKLDKTVLNRYTESIGRALDDAQQRRQALEAGVPEGSSAADAYQSVRDHEQSAAEHYRSLVQEAAKTNPDPGNLKDDAGDIISELKDAEAAHKKTFSVSSGAAKEGGAKDQGGTRNPSGKSGSSSSSSDRSSY